MEFSAFRVLDRLTACEARVNVLHMQTDFSNSRESRDRPALTRSDLDRLHPVATISRGRWANADLLLIEHAGSHWVLKDFRTRSFLVRNMIGRLLAAREIKGLQRLASLRGIPAHAFRVDAHAIAYRFVPGAPLGLVPSSCRNATFFLALEALVTEIHACGIVHLDIRNANNILITAEGQPVLIDLQSHLGTARLPAAVRRWMERFDMAGVYKHWARHHPQSLDAHRMAQLAAMNRWRKFWFLRGYFGARKRSSRSNAASRAV